MSSPVTFNKPFKLVGFTPKHFHLLGPEIGYRGNLHTLFLSKPTDGSVITVQEPVVLNGFCKYAFVQDPGGICGFIIISPSARTTVKTACVVIGSESEHYKTHTHLQPQGVLIMESTDSNTIFVALDVTSSLLVEVDI